MLGGAERRSEPVLAPFAATGGSATAKAAGVGGAHRHRHLRPSKRACGALAREKGPCATRQGARVIGDMSLTKTTLNLPETLNFLKVHRNSVGQVFDEMILACGKFSLSCFFVGWPLIASGGCLNFGGIFGEEEI